ncbi:hypothetical protein NQ315_009795 [Exocentrus adspersus]|uniref:Resistance to inhibitors of cholinesterase protein 3 N-terminal domain-containing protein n=1 Tax=Exocentrus adspersus TaxID=1586481 RepID=A0AAV8WHE8_9CUCU|nr:hypothetical protein NQ315_009795 [Exocentrus adspersus]
MTERVQSRNNFGNPANISMKMANDLTPRKTLLIIVVVVACFAVLWPKVFYPMLVGSANQRIKPSPIDKTTGIKQERPPHLRSELVHPAFRERGRAIPQPQTTSARSTVRVVEGRPGPIPGMRPTLGGAGHVVPPPKQGTGSMGLIMPIYTIGIVVFFTYTVLKLIFKKQPESLYPPVEPDPNFRREVFESDRGHAAPKLTREGNVVANGNLLQEEQASVQVLGMEMTASCEGGQKWSRPGTPVCPSPSPPPPEPVEPPQEIFLEGALPAQSHLLVADSATEAEKISSEEDPAVVLAGKMTLSVISLDSSDNGTDEDKKQGERSSSNASDEFEKIERLVEDSLQQVDIEQIEKIDVVTELESAAQSLEIQKPQDEKGVSSNLTEPSAEEAVSVETTVTKTENSSEQLPSAEIKEKLVDEIQLLEQIQDEIEEGNIVKELVSTVETWEIEPVVENFEQVQAEATSTEEGKAQTEDLNMTVEVPVTKTEVSEDKATANVPEESISEQTDSQNIPTVQEKESVASTEPSNLNVEAVIQPSETAEITEPTPSSSISEKLLPSSPGSFFQLDLGDICDISRTVANLTQPNEEEGTTDAGALSQALIEGNPPPALDEKESFDKLNEAISDLSAELRSTGEEIEPENVEAVDEDEEIEYEYEEGSGSEITDEEIPNAGGLENDLGDGQVPDRVNGDNQEHSKYATTSSATLAENEISDEEIIENEDEDIEVEEIIEYVTDDEAEGDGIEGPVQENDTNHLPE